MPDEARSGPRRCEGPRPGIAAFANALAPLREVLAPLLIAFVRPLGILDVELEVGSSFLDGRIGNQNLADGVRVLHRDRLTLSKSARIVVELR